MTATNPAHYKDGFSNGAQPIDIIRHLTYSGGQVARYVIRSCRRDESLNKGAPEEDLKKAIWYAFDELAQRFGPEAVEDAISEVRKEHPGPDAVESDLTSDKTFNVGDKVLVVANTSPIHFIPIGSITEVADLPTRYSRSYRVKNGEGGKQYISPDDIELVEAVGPRRWDSLKDIPRGATVRATEERYAEDGGGITGAKFRRNELGILQLAVDGEGGEWRNYEFHDKTDYLWGPYEELV